VDYGRFGFVSRDEDSEPKEADIIDHIASASWEADSRSASIITMNIDLRNWSVLRSLGELIREIYIDFMSSNLGAYRICIDVLWIHLIEVTAVK
jgi:hypothetical protein